MGLTPEEASQHFPLAGDVARIAPVAGGYIHGSWRIKTGGGAAYLLQRLNRRVFPRPDLVMENVACVTAHLGGPLRLVSTCDGSNAHVDDTGDWWRVYDWIPNTVARESVTSADDAHAAARMYGEFQRRLADLAGPRLHETIPHFHDTPRRLAALHAAIAADTARRAAGCRREIERVLAHAHLAPMLLDAHARGDARERVVHNDAKLANILFDASTNEPVCVVDLDTVMPGLPLYDFGDMARTMTSTAAEDADPTQVDFRRDWYDALVAGYCAGAGDLLSDTERTLLPTAARVITYEQAIRFLTDHLAGDVYYPVSRPDHNLVRARGQLALLEGARGI